MYQRMLERELPRVYHYDASGTFSNIFMHDNAPIHTAHVVTDWLTSGRYEVID